MLLQNISVFSWIRKSTKFMEYHHISFLNTNINQILSEYILDQMIHWKTWTLIFWLYWRIDPSIEYSDIFLDPQVHQIYRISSYQCTEYEYKSTFIRIYIGSKDTLKNVNSNILSLLQDWSFYRIFRYFLESASPPNI